MDEDGKIPNRRVQMDAFQTDELLFLFDKLQMDKDGNIPNRQVQMDKFQIDEIIYVIV